MNVLTMNEYCKRKLDETYLVVHLTRNIYGLSPKKEANKIFAGFKRIYSSTTVEGAYIELDQFKKDFKEHKTIIKKVESFMIYLEPLFELTDSTAFEV